MKSVLPIVALRIAVPLSAVTVERDAGGATMRNADEMVRVTVCGPSLIHVVAGRGEPRGASPAEPCFVQQCKPAAFDFVSEDRKATVSTTALRVVFDLNRGLLTFQDASGNTLIAESDREPRQYDRVEANGENLYRASERFILDAQHGLYGLGQHQNGVFNYRGTLVEPA